MTETLTPPRRYETSSAAFPRIVPADMAALSHFATCQSYEAGEVVFRAGESDIDLFVVEEGGIDIYNPADDHRLIVTHGPGEFAGDIDVLTRRPVIVNAVAQAGTHLLRVPGSRIREMLTKIPRLGEQLLIAFQERRLALTQAGVLGLKVVGPGSCKDTMLVREFLYKNFVPFTWYDSGSDKGKELVIGWGSPRKSPVIECNDGQVLINPSLRELAHGARVWQECPTAPVDLAVVGAGPAGMAAAVYAASEGLSTIVLDRLGPGGQAGGSSKIENFIGFPSGLSGTDLATRGVLQMIKFGAKIATPISVERIETPEPGGTHHTLFLDCGAHLLAKTVLVTTGVRWRTLNARGADQFDRAGIYYACTAVEAMLFDNKDVAVVGAGNSAGQAAMFLAECCRDRRVYLLVRRTLGPGMSQYLARRIRAAANITIIEGVEVSAANGKQRLESIELNAYAPEDGASTSDAAQPPKVSSTQTIPVSAVFVFIGADPGASWLPKSIARDSLGYIKTGIDALRSGQWPLSDREPCPLETTVPGILAAGDVRSGSTKRVGFAVGDGSMAVTCVHKLTAIQT